MPPVLHALLARDGAGLAIAAALALLAAGLSAGEAGAPAVAAPAVLAVLVALGAIRHLVAVAAVMRCHPPPGRRVDVGGFRLHVLAEGEAREGRPTVVWFAGGHLGGSAIAHLHAGLRDLTRSVLIDRAGTDWSDIGPFPRTTAREADECLRALDAAGEQAPFLLVGHSFGGFLAASMARRRPDQVAGVVLLDATPPDTLIYGPRMAALRAMRVDALRAGLLRLVGVHATARERAARSPAWDRAMGERAQVAAALDVRARGRIAAASIFRELSPEGMAACAWETAAYDGDLDDMPLWLVAPATVDRDVSMLPEYRAAPPAQRERIARVIARTRERYMLASRHATRVVTPDGLGHLFPYEDPDFVIGLVRRIVLQCAAPRQAAA